MSLVFLRFLDGRGGKRNVETNLGGKKDGLGSSGFHLRASGGIPSGQEEGGGNRDHVWIGCHTFGEKMALINKEQKG